MRFVSELNLQIVDNEEHHQKILDMKRKLIYEDVKFLLDAE